MYGLAIAGLIAITAAMSDGAPPATGAASAALVAERAAAHLAVDTRDWDWRGRVDRGDAVEIKGVNGDIRAEAASGNEVVVEARLTGRRDDPNTVEMVVLQHAGGVTICAVYPTPRGREPNECLPGAHGRSNVQKNDVSVDFTVRVPAGVNFVGRTVNGDAQAHGIRGDARVSTVNGGVDISATGIAEASTVNGSITVTMGRADWDGTLDFNTVNGSITLEMPGELNTEVSFSTVNGHISSDYPLTVDGKWSPRHVRGTIGDGGRTLVIKTVNGSVQIRRS